jgi:hypothetical protein
MAFLHSILAMEVCFQMQPGDALIDQLRQAITRGLAPSTPGQKWRLYSALAQLLHARLPEAVSGCWDFFDDNGRALSDYEMWFQGMATREGARTSPSGVGDAYRGQARYLTFTLALLLQQGTATERTLAHRCNIPEGALWHRGTFARILEGVPAISFAAVKSDVLYLIPRDVDWGLTADDLRAPKFNYLRPLT